MKKILKVILASVLLIGIIAMPGLLPKQSLAVQAASLRQETDPPGEAVRPLLYIAQYHTDGGGKNVSPWGKFGLTFTVGNNGHAHARNIVMTFSSQVFDPLDGSVITFWEVYKLTEDNETHTHFFKVNDLSTWMYSGTITATTTYTDEAGTPYSDTFIFTITIDQQPGSGSSPTATPTAKAVNRPQMIIHSYETDVKPLQPGSNFKLKMSVSNAGNADARAVSVVFGGGATGSTHNPEGTPDPQGVGGGSGDVSNFAPLGNSNVVLLGDMIQGATMMPEQSFIVNVSATPGAYPFKISFVYSDPAGNRLVDDAVITLLVHSLPQLDITFYRPVEGSINVDMGGPLPIQITNLGKKPVVLGNVVATSQQGNLMNNSMFLGSIEAGGYQTFDPMFMPNQPGPATIELSIGYTDDFNQTQTFKTQLEVNVEAAMPTPEPFPATDEEGNPVLDEDGNPVMIDPMAPWPDPGQQPTQKESFFGKLWNALKAFFGISPAPGNDGNMGPFDDFQDGGGGGGGFYNGG